ncbi:phage tail protein [Acinetobacter towneri]|uniref:phage tail protein n=1 Tax=Acinetobacter towneri TaxID=202956 RepID=UPI00209832E4|nr:phage tail protein [Acinetobacter towneri]MCO8058044.1 phage tail protein [Acinetobacter towneri]MCO8063690.1 phage tail protein [Acinetobacter towneri]
MNIEVILANYDFSQVETTKSIVWMAVAAVVALVFSVYSYIQMRKMQKKNRPKPNQLDGTIADEGTSFCDIAGSPHVHANITDIWGKSTQAIKKKSGGFLGIGKTSQVTGYRYYAKFAAFIGNRIEKFIGINFDNRKWILHDPKYYGPNFLQIYEPNLFGENEGGVAGVIDIHTGLPEPEPNPTYQQYFPLVSGYPYQSYLVFRGFSDPIDGQAYAAPAKSSFYLGNSNYMKEMLLWVKRTRVRNDGQGQWYDAKSEIDLNTQYITDSHVFENGLDFINIGVYDAIIDFTDGRTVTRNDQPIKNNIRYNLGDNPEIGDTGRIFVSGSYDKQAFVRFIVGSYHKNVIVAFGGDVRVLGSKNLYSPNDYFLKEYALIISGEYNISIIVKATGGFHQLNLYADFYADGNLDDWKLESGDINPIHKIREILTDDTAMAKPEADVNDANFMKAADRIYNEGLGVSWAIDEKSCIDAIEELCYHVEAGIRVNRQTGLYEMVLFRDDWFAEDEIHTIAENKIKDLSLEVMNSDDIVNQLNVTYYDRERIKNSTFSVYENGSILTMGKANAESIDFPYFMNMRNAEIVANWKLKQYSTPAWKGTLTTGWHEARKWNRYDLVEITWSKKWQGTILARIMKIDLGNGLNNEVMIDFEEVVPYSGEMNTSIVVDDSAEEKAEPAKPAIGETFEAPYYIAVQNIGQRKIDEELAHNPDVGFTFSTYRRPQWNALYTEITTINADDPENGWVIDGNAEFVTSGQFDQVVSKTATQISVKNINIEGLFGSGDLIVAGTWLAGVNGLYEFMIVESFDSETNILTVKRGALDTLPTQWDIDGWFFVSNADDGLFSLTEYSAGDNVRASSLTVTPSSKLEHLGSAPVYMRSRAIRPYPPANVKINGEYWPDEIETDLVITWSDRNRLSLNAIDWYSPSVTIEQNTQTHLIISQLDENQIELATSNVNVTGAVSYAMSISSMQADTRFVKVAMKTVRDGFDCLNPFKHTVELSQFFSAPYNITYTVSDL